MKINKGYFYVFLASILWASTATVSKLLFLHLDNIQVLFYSALFSSASLLIISIIQGKFSLIMTYKLRDYLVFAFMGFIGVFSYQFFLQASLLRMSAQEAFIINYSWPIFVVIFAWLILKEKMTLKKILGLIFSLIGVIVVVTKGNFSMFAFNISGVLFALLGAMFYGFFSILGKKQTYDKLTSVTFFYIFSFLFSAIALFVFSSPISLSPLQIGGLLWLGIFANGLGFVFWFLALKYGDTAKVSNLIFMTPFLSLIYIYFLLGEKISIYSIAGLIIIIAGILVQSVDFKKLSNNYK